MLGRRLALLQNRRVPVSVPDPLAEPTLRLQALSSHCHDVDQRIGWVSTTELPDPLPFRAALLATYIGAQARRGVAHHLAGLRVAGHL